jgi:hypothetical protein
MSVSVEFGCGPFLPRGMQQSRNDVVYRVKKPPVMHSLTAEQEEVDSVSCCLFLYPLTLSAIMSKVQPFGNMIG